MVWVFGVVTKGAEVVVLVAPLKELGSAAEVPRGVFRNASLLCWGKGSDGGF